MLSVPKATNTPQPQATTPASSTTASPTATASPAPKPLNQSASSGVAPVNTPPPALSKISLTSIRTGLKDQARQQQEARLAAQANRRAVDMDNLKLAWKEAVETLAADKGMYKASLMLSDLVYEHPNIKVSALLSCFDFIRQRRLELLNFFKAHYSDEDLNVIIDQKPDEEPKEKVMSTREVFEEMARKNPALKALKEQLGLDLEL